ncbi:hypothetical protein A2572_02695 [Candidatus Collierbacteria bacterium RIFOXYD1_FULL_40_9]|uniref:Nucleoside diphosphate kinase-like domain-containing protein n=1 Tax=Candidatus Collierbacteria bacterium RIFOXYD1_FULL_40_9 TaxID=1817731 RepID=A0A1F5FW77_9BACT|nr:MAG: hypothetical protein A2572_02695 [Candidatus Collierbacteria bacterium RIFOXYD1_FULL_40_9]
MLVLQFLHIARHDHQPYHIPMKETLAENSEREHNFTSVSFVILKPLGAQEPIRSQILTQLSQHVTIISTHKFSPSREQIHNLYKPNGIDQSGTPKPYFAPMVEYFVNKEIEFVLLGSNQQSEDTLIKTIDMQIGFWNPNEANRGEIRHLMIEHKLQYDLESDYDNLIHSPSSAEDMRRELEIFLDDISNSS